MSRPLVSLLLVAGSLSLACAGEVRLKNGTVLQGRVRALQSLATVVTRTNGELASFPIIQVRTPLRHYFVPARDIAELNNDEELDRYETFDLSKRRLRSSSRIRVLGIPEEIGPFDEFGRRRLIFRIKDRTLRVYQSVTQLTPRYATLVARNIGWQHGIAINALPPEKLDRWLRGVTKPDNIDDRLAIARFYLQANLYRQARRELNQVIEDFPDESSRADRLRVQLNELVGQKILDELKRRRTSAQHALFRSSIAKYPVDQLSNSLRRQVRELLAADRDALARLARAKQRLGNLLTTVSPDDLRQDLRPLVDEITTGLDIESLDRLVAFLQFADDTSLAATERIALAGSGWLIGSANATRDAAEALRLRKARDGLLDALRADDADRPQIVAELESLEGIGPRRIAQLISLLPPIRSTRAAKPGIPLRIAPTTGDALGYWVILPPEYNPHHRYPALVALHSSGGTPAKALRWWNGTEEKPRVARQRGYIMIAPELPGVQPVGAQADSPAQLQIGPALHRAVWRALVDARKRFRIDSDRTFLVGHGQGATAAFEIGMSHPGWFAGVVPIVGSLNSYCTRYWRNAQKLPWYIVNGELDQPRTEGNASGLNRMLRYRFPMIYCEYAGRGYEFFNEEAPAIVDWMERTRRNDDPREFETVTLRPSDNTFHWVDMHELTLPDTNGTRKRPLRLKAKITVGNTIHVNAPTRHTTIWLSPATIDFERRVQFRINGRSRRNLFLTPKIGDMIADFHRRGDREKLYWVRLDFN